MKPCSLFTLCVLAILLFAVGSAMCQAQQPTSSPQPRIIGSSSVSYREKSDLWFVFGLTPKYGLTGGAGGRYKHVGLEISADNGADAIPGYSKEEAPSSKLTTYRYKKSAVSFSVLGCLDLSEWLMLNVSGGYLYARSTIMQRAMDSGVYYADGSDSKDSRFIAGAAATFYPLEWLSVSAGWNSFNGIIIRTGYSWYM